MTRYRSLLHRATRDAPAPGTPEWRTLMTASKVAATFTPSHSPHQSYFSLWHEMDGHLPGQIEDEVLQRGRILEPAIAAWFQEQHPAWNVRPPRGRMWARRDDPRMAATPDFIIEQGGEVLGLLECKSAQDTTSWGRPGTDEIPPHYMDQVQWQMYCTGETRTYVAVITGLTFREYVVNRSETRIRDLVISARAFMAALEAGDTPSVDPDAGHLATYQAVRDLHPDIDDTTVEVPHDVAAEYVAARRALRAAEQVEQAARTRVADAMGSARIAVYDGAPVAERRARGPESRPYVQAARRLPDIPAAPAVTVNPMNTLTQKAA